MRPSRVALAVVGIVAVPLYGMATLFLLYASVAGDCFPELGGQCPSDHDRKMAALRVIIVAASLFVALVAGGWKLDRRLVARGSRKRR